ncbi:hypothetical protein RQ734_22730 [Roseomonas mucosa]|uniref:hypothetical protein n=1 Tax=Roseomonas mucosa TaxID=207340 RepID=UPI0028CE0455|nr:hypothetical protein [Roseomonas mucosa]MDT8278870.1 hypothetical protein [Roseomonas mucosa]
MLPECYELLEGKFQTKREQQEYDSDFANTAQGSALRNQAEASGSNDYTGKNVTDDASGLIDVDDSHAGPDLRVWAHEGRR